MKTLNVFFILLLLSTTAQAKDAKKSSTCKVQDKELNSDSDLNGNTIIKVVPINSKVQLLVLQTCETRYTAISMVSDKNKLTKLSDGDFCFSSKPIYCSSHLASEKFMFTKKNEGILLSIETGGEAVSKEVWLIDYSKVKPKIQKHIYFHGNEMLSLSSFEVQVTDLNKNGYHELRHFARKAYTSSRSEVSKDDEMYDGFVHEVFEFNPRANKVDKIKSDTYVNILDKEFENYFEAASFKLSLGAKPACENDKLLILDKDEFEFLGKKKFLVSVFKNAKAAKKHKDFLLRKCALKSKTLKVNL